MDRLKMIADIPTPTILKNENKSYSYLKIGELELIEYRHPKNFEVVSYKCEFRNLLFKVVDRRLSIQNSVHKFVKNNSYSDFYYSDLLDFIYQITNLTEISANQFHIIKLDFSLNLLVNKPGYTYLPLFKDFKGKEFDKMKDKGFWYGSKYKLTNYNIKIYDKTEETKRRYRINLKENILRFEIEYINKREFKFLSKLSDLKDKKILQKIYDNYINKFKLINCFKEESFVNITSKEREVYFAGKNINYWILEKKLNINTYKTKRKRFKKVSSKVVNKDIRNEFIDKLNKKFQQFLNH